MRMKSPADTKERLLDAAEAVIAREGYRAASLRAITAQAGVNLAAANYHFGSKRGLLSAVLARRLHPFNAARLARIAAVRAAARREGRLPQVREVLTAIVEGTLIRGRQAQGIEQFFAFIGRSSFDPDLTVQTAFSGFMRPAFEAMLAALAETLPELPREVLSWRLQFVIGAMARVQHLTRQRQAALPRSCRPLQPAALARELASFIEGGIQAPPGARVSRRSTASTRSAS
jgi:AcrR family transcriptional regulator